MATTTRETVLGLRELGEALKGLGAETGLRMARRATNAGAQKVKAAAIAHASRQPTLADAPFKLDDGRVVQPGEIARNVIVKRVDDPALSSQHIVAVRSNKANGYIGRIASLNEFGTVKMQPQPFMRPAFEESRGDALNAIVQTLRTGIESAARAAARKAKPARTKA